eukprot:CAMPEP_0202416224 /NCGR_PEP_ID=MMETSP1128-20130828/38877_1 /ASSEMBLY_ACC=CAM_ASM_000463 /TAXON_ID=3047 /ORGANISM="Dunaliella tertiolecta, Strain CCMP1320" /LENGTH=82 /DNA_ID=CAMNT_0049023153 /DNA_START=57 /DNA_END=303 /DNA_ORIENTATION=-
MGGGAAPFPLQDAGLKGSTAAVHARAAAHAGCMDAAVPHASDALQVAAAAACAAVSAAPVSAPALALLPQPPSPPRAASAPE